MITTVTVSQSCPNCGAVLNAHDECYQFMFALLDHIDGDYKSILQQYDELPDLGRERWFCHHCRWVTDGHTLYMQIPEAS